MKSKLMIHNHDGHELFAAGLFLKLLADVEAALLLLDRGMISQARSLLRVGIECNINLAKVCQSYEFVHAFAIVAERERLRLVKGIKQSEDPGYSQLKVETTDALVQEIETRVEGKPKSKLQDWANDVGMGVIYVGPYRLFCADVHSGPAALSRFSSSTMKGTSRASNGGLN